MDRRVAAVLAVLLLTGFAIRAAPVKTGYHYWDETVYLQHGEILAGDHPDNYNEFDFRPPLLSLMLAGIFLITDSVTAVHLLLSLLATAGILLTFLLGRRLFTPATGLIAAAAYTLSIEHITFSHDILVDAVLPVLWLGTALLLLRALETRDRWTAAATGVVAGLAVLMKFTSLVIVPAVACVALAWHYRQSRSRTGAVRRTVEWPGGWAAAAGFALAVTPYLAWSHITYGSAFHTVVTAAHLSGAADPFLTYITGAGAVIGVPFLLGLPVFAAAARRDWFGPVTVTVFVLALYLPLQFLVPNRELRFLLPAMPFLAVAAASGIETGARRLSTGRWVWIAAALVAIAAIPVWAHPDVQHVRDGTFTAHSEPPTYDAAVWLRENTSEDAVLYTNYKWPALGYYSEREIQLLPVEEPFQDRIGEELPRPGYVYHSTEAPDGRDPSLSFLRSDPRFTHVRTFNGTVRLFHYTPAG